MDFSADPETAGLTLMTLTTVLRVIVSSDPQLAARVRLLADRSTEVFQARPMTDDQIQFVVDVLREIAGPA
jgi:hypothetical protein